MSRVVVDSSVIVKLLFPETDSDKANDLVAGVNALGWILAAPVVVRSEVTNAIRRIMRRNRLTLAEAMAALDYFLALPLVLFDEPDLYRQALTLTEAHSLTGYDAQYVALARSLGCNLWVADGRLLRAVGGRLPFVRSIAAYAGDPGA